MARGRTLPWVYLIPAVLALAAMLLPRQPHSATGAIPDRGLARLAASAAQPLPPGALRRGVLLVASHSLGDPNFSRTVVLVLDHGPQGAMGVVLNRRSEYSLAEVLPQVPDIESISAGLRLGGPVGTHRVILLMQADAAPAESMEVLEGVYASSSQDALRQLLDDSGAVNRFQAFAGYAGWTSGQLERELARGDWHLFQVEGRELFDWEPNGLWQRLIEHSAGRWVQARGTGETVPGPWQRGCSAAPSFAGPPDPELG